MTVKTSVKIPKWLPSPKPIGIRFHNITELKNSGEAVVQFRIDNQEFTAFVPEKFVDKSKKTIQALIVAKFDSDLLVDLPVETLTSGTRIRVPKDYIDNGTK